MDKCIDCGREVSRYGTKRCLHCYNKVRKGMYSRSDEFKKNLSNVRRGSSNPFFGRKHTIETRLKWSNERSGELNPFYGRCGLDCPNYGENNPNWRGGTTKLITQLRASARYVEWRFSIFERDDFSCVVCGKDRIYLECHHKTTPFGELLKLFSIETVEEATECEELWGIDNGITVCSECHCLIDPSRRRFGF